MAQAFLGACIQGFGRVSYGKGNTSFRVPGMCTPSPCSIFVLDSPRDQRTGPVSPTLPIEEKITAVFEQDKRANGSALPF